MRKATTLRMVAVSGVLALTLASCGSGESNGDRNGDGNGGDNGSAPVAEGDVELRMTVWTSNEGHLELFDDIASEFIEQHDRVTSITFDPLPFDDYTTTLTTQLAGGNPPDLAWVLENAAPDFVSSGALAPLTDTLQATEGYDYDDLSDAALTLWRQDGVTYGIPFSNSPFGTFVNLTLLEDADQPLPADLIASGEWTWERVAEIGAEVNEGTGAAGFVIRDFEYTLWHYLATVWNGWGAEPWSEDGLTCTFDSPEMVDALEFFHTAAFETGATPGPGTSVDFFAGDAAFTVTQISRANLLDDSFEWDLVPLPAGPDGEYAVIGQGGVGVLAQGENPDVAAEFLAFFTNPENAEQLAEFFPPPRESLLTVDVLGAANPLLSAEQIENVVIDAIATGQVFPSHTGQAELQQTARAALDDLWVPNADVPAVLDSVCAAIEPLLEG